MLNKLAPCGLSCERCFAYKGSDIKKNSRALRESLGQFDKYANRFSELLNEPIFHLYPYFKTHLDYFADTDCEGCRKSTCKLFKGCRVRECANARKVDFCFQCREFPCKQTGFDEDIEERWLRINKILKEIGPKAYYLRTKNIPRYR